MKLTLEKQIPLAFMLAILLLIVLAVFAYRSVTALDNAIGWEQSTQQTIQKIDSVFINVINAETSVRGFIITGNEKFLEPYSNAENDIKDNISQLRQLVSSSPMQKQRIADLENHVNGKFTVLRRQIESRRRQDVPVTAQIIETGQGNDLTAKIRSVISEMKNEELSALRERENQLNRSYTRAFYVITFGSVAGVVLLVLASIAILSETNKRGRVEEELKTANKNLESRIVERTKNLVKANEALRYSGIFNEAVLNSLSSHIAVIDKQGNVTAVNKAWQNFSRNNRNENESEYQYIGTNYFDVCTIGAQRNESTGEIAEKLKQVLNGEIEDFSIEYPCHSETEKRWFLLNATALQTPEGGAVIVHTDITFRKKAEAEREELLANEQQARQEAETANRMRDEFLATVSHELRNPLNAILGWARMLEQNQLDEQARKKAVNTIVRSAEAQNHLIEDLLDVSRIISGKLRLEIQPVSPQSFVEAAIETVLPAAEAKGIEIEARIDQPVETINGDPNRLQQVIWNLLSNAIKFTPHGGRVEVGVSSKDSIVEISVSDNGAGISEDFLPHVFERFRQADASTVKKFGGLGLGLAIVRHITEMHGGTVEVFSEGEDTGSTFTVKLPVTAVLVEAEDVSLSTDIKKVNLNFENALNFDGLNILVVDDEEDTRALLSEVLRHFGAKVASASSAEEAFSLFTAEKFDIVVSDIGMPSEDGYSLMRRIRALPNENANVPSVALTAFARPQDRMQALASGFQTHLSKPVEPGELAAVIGSLTGRLRINPNGAPTENTSAG